MEGVPSARELLQDRSVRRYLGMLFCSTMAAMCQGTALGLVVFNLTRRELDLGLLGLVEFLPSFLLVPVTGHVADRFDRRRIVALALLGEVVAFVALAAYVASGPTSVTVIFAIVLVFGVARAFWAPAGRSLPPDVVGRISLPRFAAINAATWQTASIVGPVLGGFLFLGAPWWPFAAAAVLASLGIPLVLLTKVPFHDPAVHDEAPAGFHNALEGLGVIRRNSVLFGAISLDLFAVLFGGAVALLPALAEERLGVGALGLGWLRAASGIGAAAVALVLAAHPVRRHVGKVLLLVVAVFGVATVVLGLTYNYWVAFAAMLVLAGADSVSVFIRATLVPLVTPDAARGRVLAVEGVFIGASNELGAFESGVVGQLLGASAAVALGGVATLVIAGLWWVVFPALRDVDRFTELGPPAERVRSLPT